MPAQASWPERAKVAIVFAPERGVRLTAPKVLGVAWCEGGWNRARWRYALSTGRSTLHLGGYPGHPSQEGRFLPLLSRALFKPPCKEYPPVEYKDRKAAFTALLGPGGTPRTPL